MSTDTAIRPALRYHGGKFLLAPWIMSHFPQHAHYVEPCFGAGSILLRKQAVKLETVNDLNGRIVNYFRMLRDFPSALIRLLDLTPWAYDEYILSQEESGDELENARRFHIMCWMSIHGGPVPTGFRVQNSINSRYATPATDLLHHDLWTIARRLKNVQILNEDALRTIDRYRAAADALIYFDPPYVPETRTFRGGIGGYASFEVSNQFHIDAAGLLCKTPAMVIVSGYNCPLYAGLYEENGWHRVDKETQTNSGGKRIESLWLSPLTWEMLRNNFSGLPIFGS